MEIIVLPYMAISFAIAFAIFSPLNQIDDLHDWSFARIETGDLFAVFLPISGFLALVSWLGRGDTIPVSWLVLIATAIVLFSFAGFVAGLYVLAKLEKASVAKRVSLIGVILPLGSFLVIAWITVPAMALAGSIYFSIGAAIALVPVTWILRMMSIWVATQHAGGITNR